MAAKTIGEIITEVRSVEGKKAKAAVLKKYDGPALRELLRVNSDPNIKFALKEGPVPYQSKVYDPNGMTHLLPEWRRFKRLFLVGGHKTLKQSVREENFAGLLRSLEPVEAEIVLQLKDKKLKGVPRDAVDEAFPGLLPE